MWSGPRGRGAGVVGWGPPFPGAAQNRDRPASWTRGVLFCQRASPGQWGPGTARPGPPRAVPGSPNRPRPAATAGPCRPRPASSSRSQSTSPRPCLPRRTTAGPSQWCPKPSQPGADASWSPIGISVWRSPADADHPWFDIPIGGCPAALAISVACDQPARAIPDGGGGDTWVVHRG